MSDYKHIDEIIEHIDDCFIKKTDYKEMNATGLGINNLAKAVKLELADLEQRLEHKIYALEKRVVEHEDNKDVHLEEI